MPQSIALATCGNGLVETPAEPTVNWMMLAEQLATVGAVVGAARWLARPVPPRSVLRSVLENHDYWRYYRHAQRRMKLSAEDADKYAQLKVDAKWRPPAANES